MKSLSLTVLIMSATLIAQDKPPVAKVAPKQITMHGETRVDNYFWLREKTNPEVIQYLGPEGPRVGLLRTEAVDGLPGQPSSRRSSHPIRLAVDRTPDTWDAARSGAGPRFGHEHLANRAPDHRLYRVEGGL